MNAPLSDPWQYANKSHLLAHLARLRHTLDTHAGKSPPPFVPQPPPALPAPGAVDQLCALFGLSDFERDVLLLCAGVELDGAFGVSCSAAHGGTGFAQPTFGLALAILPGANWAALSPNAPLRYWRLVELAKGAGLTHAGLLIDERILHFLTGVHYLDEALASMVCPLGSKGTLAPSHIALADDIATAWQDVDSVLQLIGPDHDSKREVAIAVCAWYGCGACVIDAAALPTTTAELARFMRLWERESRLGAHILVIDTDNAAATADAERHDAQAALDHLIAHLDCELIVLGVRRRRAGADTFLTFDVARLSLLEQQLLWHQSLGSHAAQLAAEIPALAFQFNLSAPEIRTVCARALSTDGRAASTQGLGGRLWECCRMQARLRLDQLVQRIEARADWDDLILPEAQKQMLREILVQVRERPTVYQDWGFAAQGARGLGLVALFAGSSGTGKTMAAEVIARTLRLDLYRVDLSAVVSKYIGETETNLRLVFDAAEAGGAILLFDEADALFGKRTEVKDSHDRHANIEVSYLLQRMEAYPGLAILTTNLKESLDTAFLRRLRFIVHFPFPDLQQRTEIWRRAFPVARALGTVDYARLARLNIAGGNIRNVALHAAFTAANAGQTIGMGHLLAGARNEYDKLGRPLADSEIGDWV